VHPSDVQIDQLLHGELPSSEADAVRQHLVSCQGCARRRSELAAEEYEITDALRQLDQPAAMVDVATIVGHSRARSRTFLWRLAAGIAVAVAAGSAVAMPGSPLHEWLSRQREGATRAVAPPAAVQETPAPAVKPAGISLTAGDSVAIALDEPQSAGRMRILVHPAPTLDVRATGGEAAFALSTHGVRIRNHGSTASYDIIVPASATMAEVRIAGRLVFASRGGTVLVSPPPQPDGSYVVTLGPAVP
jgi:hypothetical protein